MKALVIGGCGFIGSHVVDRLLADGHKVRSFNRRPEWSRPPLPGVDYQFGSLGDRMAVIEALTGVDIVFHLASSTFPGTAELNPQADVQDNLIAVLNLLDAMRGVGVRRIVYMSSGGTVYGIPEQVPTPETHPLRPQSSYGIVKVAIEQYLEHYRSKHGLSPLIIRGSNPYGPRQAHSGIQGVISTFLRRAKDDLPIEIWGDGSVVRDYVYVTDLADLCVRGGPSDVEGVLNGGSGEGTSINEIVDVISNITGIDLNVIYKPARTIDVPTSVLDVSRARELLGWKSATSLQDGMMATWRWMQSLPD
ncbi:NAD-dependent epimerase/dehydratase family protein [Defluviimonas sp. D31]|uniref:NAD-dependent epimerase/dehydratase family protein n=1 Tax=Defluviimonas sp. D31 TaxID=3083253 RepID=UPI00296FB992|nr:NAD-dependent epimerase/dehydratase family protein [Defluviimonas sp. D31]MDW4549327.1 NAD-dependent epimerase/dehydratase family protein [Defluviimonas sp. D31]